MLKVGFLVSILTLAFSDASPSLHGKSRNLASRYGDLNVNLVKSLNVRGGSRKAPESRCVNYTKIGLINLAAKHSKVSSESKKGKTPKGAKNSAVASVVDEWIQSQLSADTNSEGEDPSSPTVVGNIVAVPTLQDDGKKSDSKTFDFTLGTFNDSDKEENTGGFALGSKQHANIGNIIETIGAVADSVVVLYDIKNESRHAAIVRLVKGIKRQRSKGIHVQVFLLAEKGEAFDELNAIHDLFSGDEDVGDSIKVLQTSKYGSIYDDLRQIENRIAAEKSYVPMDIFPKLVGRVYSQLSGKALVGTAETLSFGTSSLSLPQTRSNLLLACGLPISLLTIGASIIIPKLDLLHEDDSDDETTPSLGEMYGFDYNAIIEEYSEHEDDSSEEEEEDFDFNSLMESFENP